MALGKEQLWPQMSLLHHLCTQYRFPTTAACVCCGEDFSTTTVPPCRGTCHPPVSPHSHFQVWDLYTSQEQLSSIWVQLGPIRYNGV